MLPSDMSPKRTKNSASTMQKLSILAHFASNAFFRFKELVKVHKLLYDISFKRNVFNVLLSKLQLRKRSEILWTFKNFYFLKGWMPKIFENFGQKEGLNREPLVDLKESEIRVFFDILWGRSLAE